MKAPADLATSVAWNDQGLAPAIVQDAASGRVLMLAWMNAESLRLSVAEGHAVFWSRSRGQLWRKGESSGHVQKLHEVRLDCDRDALLLRVEQIGGIACHTGRESCFFLRLDERGWQAADPVLRDPQQIYGGAHE
ncbi:MAG: phosphoribosyl-AMP cyclohydrolase [Pseudomonadales bacterium]|nr:phosphoribosyl-AMP cyclohydrolase [Pseudomonadales bacterium]MBP9033129.1 phosphoribosyl-AMP cyclohydrolase [Pseudomonadales bacterium]